MFPLRSKLFIISRSTTPLNFTDLLNSYSTEISSQNKFFDMYIVKEKATRKFLMQNFLPGMFKMTNFDRFHREAMGVRYGAFSVSKISLSVQVTLCQLNISLFNFNITLWRLIMSLFYLNMTLWRLKCHFVIS